MRILWNRDRFELDGKDIYDVREAIKLCGFTWDPDNRVWYGKPDCRPDKLRNIPSVRVSITPDALERHTELERGRVAAIEASRATNSEVDFPCPAGLNYLPYQKAGIAFALKVFGDL
jgi:SWI/SNF-related matrix-associated actin-dependent regulator 1 of chromatin subfamily A